MGLTGKIAVAWVLFFKLNFLNLLPAQQSGKTVTNKQNAYITLLQESRQIILPPPDPPESIRVEPIESISSMNIIEGACSLNKNDTDPACICQLKVNNKNTKTRFRICSKLTIKTPERRQWHRSGVFIVELEEISHLFLVFLSLTLNM